MSLLTSVKDFNTSRGIFQQIKRLDRLYRSTLHYIRTLKRETLQHNIKYYNIRSGILILVLVIADRGELQIIISRARLQR